MDDAAQRDGERRVREVLIAPLLALGLTKPASMRKAQFETMLRTLEQTLAHMGGEDLVELRERAAAHPGGKERDRFPLALNILAWAKEVKTPERGDASPFIRRVMSSDVGRAALERGYAPELLVHIRARRGEWPGAWTVSQLRAKAEGAVRRFDDLRMRQERGEALGAEDQAFVRMRAAQIAECRQIRESNRDGAET